MYEREIKSRILRMNTMFRVLVITGPRQVGKTTLLKSIMPSNMKRVSLDDSVLRDEARNNPKEFLEGYGTPLFIDEIQYAPELFPYIKMVVDENKDRGQYWLSGSQAFELMQNVTESLAGRAGIIKMNSFTYNEIVQKINEKVFDPDELKQEDYLDSNTIFERIFLGGMPELYDISGIDRNEFFNSYINTYIDRDVSEIKKIGNLEAFKRFIKVVAIRTGTTLNYSDIANDVGVSSPTIKEWMSILVATGLVYLLEAYSSNKLKRITHSPKIIFMDTGLASYLCDFENYKELQLSEYAGRFFETYVISEIIKTYSNKGVPLNISHYRNKETEEIDLIISKNQKLYPLEIKKTGTPKMEMLKNFRHLEEAHFKLGKGGLICMFESLLMIDDKNYYIPISSVINI